MIFIAWIKPRGAIFTNSMAGTVAIKTIQGPAIYLAQFAGDSPPFDSLEHIAQWASSLGYVGVQIPSWDLRFIDIERAAESDEYCDQIKSTLAAHGLQLSELAAHLQGQLVASHPAFDIFAPPDLHGKPAERQA